MFCGLCFAVDCIKGQAYQKEFFMWDVNIPDQNVFYALGMMSGTSLDGIDAALIHSDGIKIFESLGNWFIPYPSDFKTALNDLVKSIAKQGSIEGFEQKIQAQSRKIGALHQNFLKQIIADTENKKHKIDLIGIHGQTIYHAPEEKMTLQIGEFSSLKTLIPCPIINQFRVDDVQAGGQGAPLIPIYHQALANEILPDENIIFINIGGVANLTYIASGQDPVAFDTGPGNTLMDQFCKIHFDCEYDENGTYAQQGIYNATLIQKWLSHPFFHLPAPKSLDRSAFDYLIEPKEQIHNHLRNLLEFTVQSINYGISHTLRSFIAHNKHIKIIVGGGGAKNNFLMNRLQETLPYPVLSADQIGLNSDFIEAEAFAYLAIRKIKNMPSTFPYTTGANFPVICGQYVL